MHGVLDDLPGESGVAVAAYVDGRPIVDETTSAWKPDTIVCVFSVTKAAGALAAAVLADRGVLDLDQPLAAYWPEFATNGKHSITARHVLTHTAGLAFHSWLQDAVEREQFVTMDQTAHRLESVAPEYEPGTRAVYHPVTYGVLLDQIVRRLDGRSMSDFFNDEVAVPLGLDFWIGLRPEQDDRCVPVVTDAPAPNVFTAANNRAWQRLGNTAGNGFGTARSIARMYALMANGGELDGVRLLRAETLDAHTGFRLPPDVDAKDAPSPMALGVHGLGAFPGLSARSFGHGGAGGSLALADPSIGFAFALTKDSMQQTSPTAATVLRRILAMV